MLLQKYETAATFLGLRPNFLRDGQVEILEKFLDKEIIFLTAPTGWGKTAVAVFSAILSVMTTNDSDDTISSGPGEPNCVYVARTEFRKRLCVIASPHIALIHGHMKGIKEKYKLGSVHYTRELYDSNIKFMQAISAEENIFFVLLCPETFVCVNKKGQLFYEDSEFMKNNVAVIFIDELQDFMTKSTYRPDLIKMCKNDFTSHGRKLILATGTPTYDLRAHCFEALFPHLKDKTSIFYGNNGPHSITYRQNRANIYYHVSVVEKIGYDTDFQFLLKWILKLLERHRLSPENFPKTFIYIQDVDMCERLWSLLRNADVYKRHYRNRIKRYYAVFLTEDGKRYFVEDLCETDGKVAICISTNALGKGIDVPDVRVLIVVGGLPFMADVLQVFGRAGRDGNSGVAYLYVSRDFLLDDKLGTTVKKFVKRSRGACIRREISMNYMFDAERVVDAESPFPCCSNCSISSKDRCRGDVAYLLQKCLAIKCDKNNIANGVVFMPKLFYHLSESAAAATEVVAAPAATSTAQRSHYRSTATLPWLNENKETFRSLLIEDSLLDIVRKRLIKGSDIHIYFTEQLSTDMVRLGPRLLSARNDHVPLQELLDKNGLLNLWSSYPTMLRECQDALNEYQYDRAIVADGQALAARDENEENAREMKRRAEEDEKELSDIASGVSEEAKKKELDKKRKEERRQIVQQTPVDETRSGDYVASKASNKEDSKEPSPDSVTAALTSPAGAQLASSSRSDLDPITARLELETPERSRNS